MPTESSLSMGEARGGDKDDGPDKAALKPSGARNRLLWVAWLLVALAAGAAGTRALRSKDQPILQPGPLTAGHHQLELRCDVCHTPDNGVKAKACVQCHGEELRRAHDSHPEKKFTDPRNADLLKTLDARTCVACHVEHRPEMTGSMGVTLPMDYCQHCHAKIAEERPSHAGMAFNTCATAGCHNFHDNSALYEDFLAKHLDEPEQWPDARIAFTWQPMEDMPRGHGPLSAMDADAPSEKLMDTGLVEAWHQDAHSLAGVNCSDCHGSPFVNKPSFTACRKCHESEAATFLEGRHGMRLAQGLAPMTPAEAVIPMKAEAGQKQLDCNACHSAHGFNRADAAVKSCMQCHDDAHTQAYLGSPHHQAWLAEINGHAPKGSGVSCATCHMPRQNASVDSEYVFTNHNQNATLRPNEKMLRPVCLKCHGLSFSIDALADARLVAANFKGRPRQHVASLDLVRARLKAYAEKHAEGSPDSVNSKP